MLARVLNIKQMELSYILKCFAQLCPTFYNLIACSLPGSPVHGILQARILEWVASSRGIFPTQGSNPRLLHREADSLPLSHLGSPRFTSLHCALTLPSVKWGKDRLLK